LITFAVKFSRFYFQGIYAPDNDAQADHAHAVHVLTSRGHCCSADLSPSSPIIPSHNYSWHLSSL